MERETLFIEADGNYWLPKPSIWLGGWARTTWFNKHMNVESKIASHQIWGQLKHEHPLRKLVEKDGIFLTKRAGRQENR